MDLRKYRNKLIGNKDERAVSPVIGVILMVAITVILAAVIAAFVMDIGDPSQPASANFDISESPSSDEIDVQVSSIDRLDELRIESDCNSLSGTYVDTAEDFTHSVGTGWTLSANCDVGDELTFVGIYDGSEEVIRNYDISTSGLDA